MVSALKARQNHVAMGAMTRGNGTRGYQTLHLVLSPEGATDCTRRVAFADTLSVFRLCRPFRARCLEDTGSTGSAPVSRSTHGNMILSARWAFCFGRAVRFYGMGKSWR